MAAHLHGYTATLFDPLHLTVSERGLQVWAVQLHCELCDTVWLAEGAGLERLLDLVVALPSRARGLASTLTLTRAGAHMAWDVEGVTLAVAKAIDHSAAAASLLADCLPERLRLAPVSAEVAALCDHQGLPAGGEHLWFLLQ